MTLRMALASAVLAVSTLTAAVASADTLLDTGSPGFGGGGGYVLSSGQWLAVEFGVATPEIITGIDGWIAGSAGTFTIALHSDTGGIPGAVLDEQQLTFDGNEGWIGLSGLNWAVGPGSYWAAFEVRPGDTLSGAMNFPAPSPVQTAFTFSGVWQHGGAPGLGARVFGHEGAPGVPEPATWAMMMVGFGGLGAVMRKRRSQGLAAA